MPAPPPRGHWNHDDRYRKSDAVALLPPLPPLLSDQHLPDFEDAVLELPCHPPGQSEPLRIRLDQHRIEHRRMVFARSLFRKHMHRRHQMRNGEARDALRRQVAEHHLHRTLLKHLRRHLLVHRRRLEILRIEVPREEREVLLQPLVVVGASEAGPRGPAPAHRAESHRPIVAARVAHRVPDFLGARQRHPIDPARAQMPVEATTHGVRHEGGMLGRVFMPQVGPTESHVVRQRLPHEHARRRGRGTERPAFPVARPHDRQALAPVAHTQARLDAGRRPTLRCVGAAYQQDVASLLARREVDLVDRRGKARLTGEGIGHHQWKLLLVQREMTRGRIRRRHAEGALDDHHERFAPAGLHTQVVAGDHARGVDQFHRRLPVS